MIVPDPKFHIKALEYEIALLEEHIGAIHPDNAFSIAVNRAVQTYLLDRLHIVRGY